MTDIPIGSPMHRAMQQRAAAERSAGLLGWLFSRDDTRQGWFSGIPSTIHRCELVAEKGQER